MKKGLFITFEGPDGSGKTSVSSYVAKQLIGLGYSIVHTREPGGIEIAEQIRKVVLDPNNTAMDVRTEALLYAASRRQHLIEKVLPAMQDYKIVLCDRFVDSSLAYQGFARKIGIENVLAINEFAIEGHYPDLTVYLDLKADEGLKRIKHREFLDRLDQEALSFHTDVVEGYRLINERFKSRIRKVDASKDLLTVQKEALKVVIDFVKSNV